MGKYGEELLELAEKNNVFLLYEAQCCWRYTNNQPISYDLSANDFSSIRGIINGTTNYILTKMANEKLELAEVLREAQDLGYAEADPTSDIDGFDAQYKISILSRIAFNQMYQLIKYMLKELAI